MMRGYSLKQVGTGALALAALAGLAFAGVSVAQAATATATLSVSASISGACTVGGAAMAFGAYSSAAASTTNSTIQVTCTNGTNATVSLNQGANNNRVPSAGTRALANGANYLGYEIYSDSGLSTVWNTTNTQPIASTGAPISLTAYGRIPAGQNPATGSYNDTVTITVTF
jgi:spore coat protein U-like protein